MKEHIIGPEPLTKQPRGAYARGGDIFMPQPDAVAELIRPQRESGREHFPRRPEDVVAALPRANEQGRLMQARHGIREIRGGADISLDGITDMELRQELQRSNIWRNFMGAHGTDTLRMLEDVDKRIREMQNVSSEQRARALERIQQEAASIAESQRHMQEQIEARRAASGDRQSLYGEIRLTDEDRERITNEIAAKIEQARRRAGAGHGQEGDEHHEEHGHEGEHSHAAITTEDLKGSYVEKIFNRMFRNVDSNFMEDFNHLFGTAGSIEETEFNTLLTEIRDRYRSEDIKAADMVEHLIHKFHRQKEARSVLHNTYYIASSQREIKDFVGFIAHFASEYADEALDGSPEVDAAIRVREQILYQFKRENNGFIPHSLIASNPKGHGSEFENRTVDMMREMNENGLFKHPDGSKLEEWEIAKAVALSRGMGMVTWRYLEIVAECPLPDLNETNKAQQSLPWELITWDMNPMDHKFKRYRIGRALQAFLIAAGKRKKDGMWNHQEALEALAMYGTSVQLDESSGFESGMDRNNLFKIGGPFTHTGWRTFVAAMDKDMKDLEPMLKDDPGIAIKLLFDSYLDGGQAIERDAFLKDAKARGLSVAETQREWDKVKAQTAGEARTRHNEDDKKALIGATKRIPHVMLRIITDPSYNVLDRNKREALCREIFGDPTQFGPEGFDSKPFQDMYTKLETQLTYAKENLMKRRREKLTGGGHFTEEENVLLDEDLAVIKDPHIRDQARKLRDVMVTRMTADDSLRNEIINRHRGRKFMFAITAEDVPWGEFSYIKTGGRGFFTRKANDNMADKNAFDVLTDIVKNIKQYRKPEQVYEAVYKMFMAGESHDYDRTLDATVFVLKGIINLYKKDGALKVPILGDIESMARRAAGQYKGDSMIQSIMGRTIAPAWDDDDIYNFIDMFTPFLEKQHIEALRKEVSVSLPKAFWARSKLAIYLTMATLIFEMVNKVTKAK